MKTPLKKYYLLHVGVGNVGSAVVRQIRQRRKFIKASYGVDLVYCGLFTAEADIFKAQGLSNSQLDSFPAAEVKADIPRCLKLIPQPFILIDTTASEHMLPLLKQALKRGGSVVLSNKKPISGSQAQFDKLRSLGGQRLFYETTVGAGLPVIQTLKMLLASGDEVIALRGCFSGTLGFIFWQLEDGRPFSGAVLQAKKLGFTEPDPRDDLSGIDVARKVLILARLLGRKLELADVRLQRLYPKSMDKLSSDDFLKQLRQLDTPYQAKMKAAQKSGKVLRFVASIDKGGCRVGLEAVPKISEIGSLQGPDNIIVFKTRRYLKNPLVIKGPGAGVEVTAGGVFSDVLQATLSTKSVAKGKQP
ncbi:homoserine dehydrogenase [Candidatus Saccharibacteria bacterium]|nr:homoserine dehydrogenase [Candidatus Saccharibacteria bacterium]